MLTASLDEQRAENISDALPEADVIGKIHQSRVSSHQGLSPLRFARFFPPHRKESHTKTQGMKLLKYALQIFWRVKIV